MNWVHGWVHETLQQQQSVEFAIKRPLHKSYYSRRRARAIRLEVRKNFQYRELWVPVSQWSKKPLKQIVDAYLRRERIDIYRNRIKLRLVLETPAKKSIKRTVSDIDSYVREKRFAEDLGAELPLRRKSNKLYNKNLLFYNYFPEVEVVVKAKSVDDMKRRLEVEKRYLIEPGLALQKRARLLGKPTPKIKLTAKLEFVPDAEDERSLKLSVDEQGNKHFVLVRDKRRQYEHVGDLDEELLPRPETFREWAEELAFEDNSYQGDVDRAEKDLKNYYYSRPAVVKFLSDFYDKNKNKGENPCTFNKYMENIKQFQLPPAEELPPLYEVLSKYFD